MAGAAGCALLSSVPLAVEPAALVDTPGTAGSLVLRRMDRRGHKRALKGQEARHQERQRPGATPDLSPDPYGTALRALYHSTSHE